MAEANNINSKLANGASAAAVAEEAVEPSLGMAGSMTKIHATERSPGWLCFFNSSNWF